MTAVFEFVLPLILKEHTRYAPGYTEKAFQSLKLGETRADVRQVLGDPLWRYEAADETVWCYSRQVRGTDNYLLREVFFGRDGRVIEIYSEFYVD